MKREWPFLALEVLLLLVLLQSNAPEVWFWFIALLVLLTWRSLALRSRLEQRRQAQGATAERPPPPAA
jgi:ABC-type microcin C transport system permease subunit YejE